MFLAEELIDTTSAPLFHGFDVFVILFTIVIAIGVIRALIQPKKNFFAIGWGLVCLGVFVVMDVAMVANWLGLL